MNSGFMELHNQRNHSLDGFQLVSEKNSAKESKDGFIMTFSKNFINLNKITANFIGSDYVKVFNNPEQKQLLIVESSRAENSSRSLRPKKSKNYSLKVQAVRDQIENSPSINLSKYSYRYFGEIFDIDDDKKAVVFNYSKPNEYKPTGEKGKWEQYI